MRNSSVSSLEALYLSLTQADTPLVRYQVAYYVELPNLNQKPTLPLPHLPLLLPLDPRNVTRSLPP